MKILSKITVVSAGLALCFGGSVLAVTLNSTADLSFQTALTLAEVNNIDFGIVEALNAQALTIDPDDTLSAGTVIGGTQEAAEITITGANAGATITVNNFATVDNGVTLSAPTCTHNAASINCEAGASVTLVGGGADTLLVGITATVDGTQAAGTTAAPAFDVVVDYN